MDKIEFINDFNGFYIEVKKEGIEASFIDVATLYAIYRKDIRATRFLDAKANNHEKATEKQIKYIKNLAEKKGISIRKKELENLTKEEASTRIETLLGGE